MPSRRGVLTLLIASFLVDLSARAAFVALPLIVLTVTGSVTFTGVVSGAIAVPLLVSPLWARRLRQWAARPRTLALCSAVEAVGALLVPLGAMVGLLPLWLLVVAGVVIGSGRTLTLPARQALLADVQQQRVGTPIGVLAWQEAASRATSVLGPALGAVAVAAGQGLALMFAEVVAMLVAAVMTAAVATPHLPRDTAEGAPGIVRALRGQRDIALGWVIRGAAGATWFAFSLGLALDGARRGTPGITYAIGIGAYGLGAVLATLAVGRRRRFVPSLGTAALGWSVNGLAWVLMGVWPEPLGYATGGLLGGVGAATGFATITRLIGERTAGGQRRSLLAGQLLVVESATAMGMFVGGALLQSWGVSMTFVVTGALLLAVAAPIGMLARSWSPDRREAG
ncbi:MFS family permease [Microbacterium resistens]|uniref:MFS family permease n=1 Tax=Microbacterium resistens TaxID=156977 RepID=A0ABU1SGA3_9MICO|nr:hypothetical protein [Microbacterium resistens]MDR6868649.1 MFS family permease [Microbacterium resistens]